MILHSKVLESKIIKSLLEMFLVLKNWLNGSGYTFNYPHNPFFFLSYHGRKLKQSNGHLCIIQFIHQKPQRWCCSLLWTLLGSSWDHRKKNGNLSVSFWMYITTCAVGICDKYDESLKNIFCHWLYTWLKKTSVDWVHDRWKVKKIIENNYNCLCSGLNLWLALPT